MWNNFLGQLENVIESTFNDDDDNSKASEKAEETTYTVAAVPPPTVAAFSDFMSFGDEISLFGVARQEKEEGSLAPPPPDSSERSKGDELPSDADEEEASLQYRDDVDSVPPKPAVEDEEKSEPQQLIEDAIGPAHDDDIKESLPGSGEVQTKAVPTAVDSSENPYEKSLLKFQEQLCNEMNEKDKVLKENAKMKKDLMNLGKQLEEAIAKVSSNQDAPLLRSKLDAEVTKSASLMKALEKKREECDQLQEDLQEYIDEIASLKSAIQRQEEADRASQQRVGELEVLSDMKSSQLGSLQTKVNDLVLENNRLKALVNDSSKVDSEVYKRLRENNLELEAEVERLSGELQSAMLDYESRLSQMDEAVFEATTRANDAEVRLEEMERSAAISIQSVRSDIESIQALLSQTTKVKNTLENQNEELRKENQKLKAEQKYIDKKLEETVTTQQYEIEDLQQEKKVMVDRMSAVENERDALSQQLAKKEKEINELKQREWSVVAPPRQTREEEEHVTREAAPPQKSLVQRGTAQNWKPSLYPGGFGVPFPTTTEAPVTNPKLEAEVVRQSLVIKQLREELDAMRAASSELCSLREKHDILLQMYGEAEERIAVLQKGGSSINDG